MYETLNYIIISIILNRRHLIHELSEINRINKTLGLDRMIGPKNRSNELFNDRHCDASTLFKSSFSGQIASQQLHVHGRIGDIDSSCNLQNKYQQRHQMNDIPRAKKMVAMARGSQNQGILKYLKR